MFDPPSRNRAHLQLFLPFGSLIYAPGLHLLPLLSEQEAAAFGSYSLLSLSIDRDSPPYARHLLAFLHRIWDRRCSTSDCKAAGSLSGHIEGITYIDSRGDGRYFISNGKDQTTKLWDVRGMSSKPEYFKRRGPHWDYRYMAYPSKAKNLKHPRDQSVATYRGHSVLCTLIRCHFSPAHNTGQKYIYTGSHDGCVYIYEVVTGAQVAKLDLRGSTVRDCSWHPYYPILACSSWDCIVARWEFPGTDSNPALARKRMRRR